MEYIARFFVVFAFAAMSLPFRAFAVDGVILIDQNKALAGNVTPGDTAGFPVSITQPGSYRLSGNLTVPNADTDAIVISANQVTIDLNGFSIIGPVVCSGTPVTSCAPGGSGNGIRISGNLTSIAVHNGGVRGMGNVGVLLTNGNAHLVEKVRAENNGSAGIAVLGNATHNTVLHNGGSGIIVGFGAASHNAVFGNGLAGISAGTALVFNNTVTRNGFGGLRLNTITGYRSNVMNDNNGPEVDLGVALGPNLCDGAIC